MKLSQYRNLCEFIPPDTGLKQGKSILISILSFIPCLLTYYMLIILALYLRHCVCAYT